jgi:hypothetical protein
MERRSHTEWCARGAACGLDEHRYDPHVVAVPGVGRMVVVRVLAADGSEYAEVRGSVRLPESEVLARRRLLRLLGDLAAALGGWRQ